MYGAPGKTAAASHSKRACLYKHKALSSRCVAGAVATQSGAGRAGAWRARASPTNSTADLYLAVKLAGVVVNVAEGPVQPKVGMGSPLSSHWPSTKSTWKPRPARHAHVSVAASALEVARQHAAV